MMVEAAYMGKQAERIYEHAPLTEVVAEVHWPLSPLQVMPGTNFDPFYPLLEDSFTGVLAASGYSHVEQRVPPDVPREMLGHQAVRLFRKAPNEWPVYQIGPGVFTANVVPPYGGWSRFRPFVIDGCQWLAKAHPLREGFRADRVILRYMNTFSEVHGLQSPRTFIEDYLGFSITWPEAIINSTNRPESISLSGRLQLPLARLPNASAELTWQEGRRPDGSPVVLLNIGVNAMLGPPTQDLAALAGVFDEAHRVISDWFEALIERKIRPLLGGVSTE